MKKCVLSLMLIGVLTFGSTVPCLAAPMGTYKTTYVPVSQQSWYKDLQNASKSLTGSSNISIFKNLKFDFKF